MNPVSWPTTPVQVPHTPVSPPRQQVDNPQSEEGRSAHRHRRVSVSNTSSFPNSHHRSYTAGGYFTPASPFVGRRLDFQSEEADAMPPLILTAENDFLVANQSSASGNNWACRTKSQFVWWIPWFVGANAAADRIFDVTLDEHSTNAAFAHRYDSTPALLPSHVSLLYLLVFVFQLFCSTQLLCVFARLFAPFRISCTALSPLPTFAHFCFLRPMSGVPRTPPNTPAFGPAGVHCNPEQSSLHGADERRRRLHGRFVGRRRRCRGIGGKPGHLLGQLGCHSACVYLFPFRLFWYISYLAVFETSRLMLGPGLSAAN